MLASDLPFAVVSCYASVVFSFDFLVSRCVNLSLEFLWDTLKVSILRDTFFTYFQILAVENVNLTF